MNYFKNIQELIVKELNYSTRIVSLQVESNNKKISIIKENQIELLELKKIVSAENVTREA